jgi:NADH pyrophosphatase NudC (nudix superfamily)
MSAVFRYCPRCAAPMTDAERDEALRRVCSDPDCGYIHWNNPTPVVAAIVEHDGRIVLAHNRSWPPEWYGLITGFLEAGETPEQGVLREVAEELALRGRIEAFVGHYDFAPMNQLIIAYHVRAEGTIRLNEELDDYRRIPPEKLRPWPGGTGAALADWLRARGLDPG